MDVQRTTFKNNITYISCDYLSFGDYDNSCAVERANVKVLKEEYPNYKRYSYRMWEDKAHYIDYLNHVYKELEPNTEIVEIYGDFGYTKIWIREDIDQENDYINSLDSYPALNDEVVTEVKDEMENELWADTFGYKYELLKTLPEEIQEKIESLEENNQITDEQIRECYDSAKEIENEYFEVQMGGNGWIDLDKIKNTFQKEIYGLLEQIKRSE